MIELIELGQLEGRKKRRKRIGKFLRKAIKFHPLYWTPPAMVARGVIKTIKRKKAKKAIPVVPEYKEERQIIEPEVEEKPAEAEVISPPTPEVEERLPEEESTPEEGGEAMEGIEIYGLDGLDKSLWQRIKAIGKRIEKKVVRPAIKKVAPTEEGEIPALAPEQPQVTPSITAPIEEGIGKYLPYILIVGGGVLVLTMFRRRGKLSEYNDYGCGC